MKPISTVLRGVAIMLLATNRSGAAATAEAPNAIRPFHINISQTEIDDLRKRVLATRWPDKETVNDQSQGVQLATTQALSRYWTTDYDWRKCAEKLDTYPQFVTNIDGLDIHFIHVRSKSPNALPLIVPTAGRVRSSSSSRSSIHLPIPRHMADARKTHSIS
jgi:hypothetical protein